MMLKPNQMFTFSARESVSGPVWIFSKLQSWRFDMILALNLAKREDWYRYYLPLQISMGIRSY